MICPNCGHAIAPGPGPLSKKQSAACLVLAGAMVIFAALVHWGVIS